MTVLSSQLSSQLSSMLSFLPPSRTRRLARFRAGLNRLHAPAWLLWLVLGTSTAFASDVPFAPRETVGSFTDVRAISLADVDRDGELDLVSASVTSGYALGWWRNLGGGSAWSLMEIDTSSLDENFSICDLEGDGDLDVINASFDDGLSFFRNPGWNWTVISFDVGVTQCGDVDGDGDLDLVFAVGPFGTNDKTLSWYDNSSGDASSWAYRSADGSFYGTGLAMADLDGDGDLDLAASRADGVQAYWWENDLGDGTSWTKRLVAADFGQNSSIRAADLDGDGDLDLLGAAPGEDKVRWWENDLGDGTSWTEHLVTDSFGGTHWAEASDLDGDGDLDVVGASPDDDEVTWWENPGDGLSWTEHVLDVAFDGAWAVAAGDVDGDGDTDIVASASEAGVVAWWENLTIHRSAIYPEQIAVDDNFSGASSVDSADVDGDGDLDVVGVASSSSEVAWWDNAGGGSGWSKQMIDGMFVGAFAARAADLDGDGDADVLAASGFGVSWWANTAGDGTTWTETVVDTDSADSVIAADLDGDGDLDVVGASDTSSRVSWWDNTAGDGSNWSEVFIDGAFGGAASVDVADVDGDGDLDVLAAGSSADEIKWWESTAGDGSTWTGHTVAVGFSGTRTVFAADLDGDGDVDVLGGATGGDAVAWWENSGDGSAWAPHTIDSLFPGPRSVTARDLDGDGDLDVLGGSITLDGAVAWWENTAGDGTVWTKHAVDETFNAYSAHAADLDGDGTADLLGAELEASDIVWWPNLGGQFALPTADVAPTRTAEGTTEAVLQIEAFHRGRTGDQDVELTTLELLLEDAAGTPLSDMQADDLLAAVSVYLDDGSGSFEEGVDTLVESVSSFSLASGVLTVPFADGDADVTLAVGSSKTYFVAVTFEAAASSASPDEVRLTHRTLTSSTAEDTDFDLPLLLEYAVDVPSGLVEVNDAPVAVGDAAMGLEDSMLVGNVLDGSAGGLDGDEEMDPLTAILVLEPSHGTLVGGLEDDGDFNYVPDPDYAGADGFLYFADDGLASSAIAAVFLTVVQVNDPPSFTVPASIAVDQDAGAVAFPGFATDLSPGPANESSQLLTFEITGNSDPGLFTVPPEVAVDGTLAFTVAPGVVGNTTITLRLMDDGGTANGGGNALSQDFDLQVVPPIFVDGFESGDTSAWSVTVP